MLKSQSALELSSILPFLLHPFPQNNTSLLQSEKAGATVRMTDPTGGKRYSCNYEVRTCELYERGAF